MRRSLGLTFCVVLLGSLSFYVVMRFQVRMLLGLIVLLDWITKPSFMLLGLIVLLDWITKPSLLWTYCRVI